MQGSVTGVTQLQRTRCNSASLSKNAVPTFQISCKLLPFILEDS